jgi:hypothetical protein
MKISYRTHPALSFLDKGLHQMNVYEEDRLHFGIRCSNIIYVTKCFEENRGHFRSKIQYITKPVSEAIDLAQNKLRRKELYEQVENGSSGTFIRGKMVYCYSLGNNDQNVLFGFYENKLSHLIVSSKDETKQITFFSEVIWKALLQEDYTYEYVAPSIINETLSMVMFLKFADVETKYLKEGQREKAIDCKYVNETKSNIQIINCTWFTNLVKSDAFKVRGHFRLQPKKKDGEWTKELIWINDFQKEGYTRKAGILKD